MRNTNAKYIRRFAKIVTQNNPSLYRMIYQRAKRKFLEAPKAHRSKNLRESVKLLESGFFKIVEPKEGSKEDLITSTTDYLQ